MSVTYIADVNVLKEKVASLQKKIDALNVCANEQEKLFEKSAEFKNKQIKELREKIDSLLQRGKWQATSEFSIYCKCLWLKF